MPDPLYSNRDRVEAASDLAEELNAARALDETVTVPLRTALGAAGDDLVTGAGREPMPTAVYRGGELNIVNSGLDVEVVEGVGVITDSYTDPFAVPAQKTVSWPTFQKTITSPTSNLIAWIMIQESAVPGVGEIVELTMRPTPQQQRDLIYVGLVSWDGAAWHDVSTPIIAGNVAHQFYEMIKDVLPPLTFVAGGVVSEQPGFVLSINESVVWEANRNHHVDRKNPNRQLFAAENPIVFRYVTSMFEVVGAPGTVMTPGSWENPLGTIDVTVGGGANTSTIQRLWLDQADNFWLTYGQNTYSTFEEARASIAYDTAQSVFSTYLTHDCILLGYVVAKKGATDWVKSVAEWIPFVAGQGGGSGGAPISNWLALTDTPASYAGLGGAYSRVDPAELGLELSDDPAEWRGLWAASQYEINDMVRDGEWLMIANKQTVDRAAPQPIGAAKFILPDAPVWTPAQFTGSVQSGMRITNITGLFVVTRLRVWIEDVSPNSHFRVVYVDQVTGETTIGNEFAGDILTVPGWVTVSADLVLGTGADIAVYVVQENSSASTITTAPWVWAGSTQNDDDPGAGVIDTNNQQNVLRINDLDDNAVDQSVLLASIIAGTTIRITQQSDAQRFVEYEVVFSNDQVGWWLLNVALIATGVGGAPALLALCDVQYTVPTPVPTTYVTLPAFFAGSPFFTGLLQLGAGAPVEDTDAHGIDLELQEYAASPDWDLMAVSGGSGGGSGGGGASLFTELTDTPSTYVGDEGKQVKVKLDGTGLEFLPGGAGIEHEELVFQDEIFGSGAPNPGASFTDVPGIVLTPIVALDPTKVYRIDIQLYFTGQVTPNQQAAIQMRAQLDAVNVTVQPANDATVRGGGAGSGFNMNNGQWHNIEYGLTGVSSVGTIQAQWMNTGNTPTVIQKGMSVEVWEVSIAEKGDKGDTGAQGPQGTPGTPNAFLDLLDTPASYAGQQGLVATVNAAENALEFAAGGGGGGGYALAQSVSLFGPKISQLIQNGVLVWTDATGQTITVVGLDAGKTYEFRITWNAAVAVSGTLSEGRYRILANGLVSASGAQSWGVGASSSQRVNVSGSDLHTFTGVTQVIVKLQGAQDNLVAGNGFFVEHSSINVDVYEVL